MWFCKLLHNIVLSPNNLQRIIAIETSMSVIAHCCHMQPLKRCSPVICEESIRVAVLGCHFCSIIHLYLCELLCGLTGSNWMLSTCSTCNVHSIVHSITRISRHTSSSKIAFMTPTKLCVFLFLYRRIAWTHTTCLSVWLLTCSRRSKIVKLYSNRIQLWRYV